LREYTLRARDGELGKVHELLFDDRSWTLRHLVVSIRRNRSRRRLVLVPPAVLGKPDGDEEVFPVDLTRAQVLESPTVDADKPVSRQQERALCAHYGWVPQWAPAPPETGELRPATTAALAEEEPGEGDDGDPHLRSSRAVRGYVIDCMDGEAGRVEDFIVDPETWSVRYIVVSMGNWLWRDRVRVSARWIDNIDSTSKRLDVKLTREALESCPEYEAEPSLASEVASRLR
jgi:hypothetical protein